VIIFVLANNVIVLADPWSRLD